MPVSYAQEKKPSNSAINSAVSWAESLAGKDSFPYTNGWGNCPSYMGCGIFVANAYGFECTSGTAYIFWTTIDQHPGDWDAPRGSLVFFDRNDHNDGKGHVALCTGNGNIIQAGYPIIAASTIKAENGPNKYLGWAWPPSEWPGRSEGASPAAIFIAVSIVIVSIVFLLLYLLFRFRRPS
jgi:cell wall-associated NlpC family hydrolase